MKHTPGPWHYRERHIKGGGSCYAITADGGNITIAETPALRIADEANARAIAALPQLLAVVWLAVDSQGWDGNDQNEDQWTHFYARARAAIAKTTGGE